MIIELCSRCHKSRMDCHCENFHPPMRILLAEDEAQNLIFSREDAQALQKFFYEDVGYISAGNTRIHGIIKRIDRFLL